MEGILKNVLYLSRSKKLVIGRVKMYNTEAWELTEVARVKEFPDIAKIPKQKRENWGYAKVNQQYWSDIHTESIPWEGKGP